MRNEWIQNLGSARQVMKPSRDKMDDALVFARMWYDSMNIHRLEKNSTLRANKDTQMCCYLGVAKEISMMIYPSLSMMGSFARLIRWLWNFIIKKMRSCPCDLSFRCTVRWCQHRANLIKRKKQRAHARSIRRRASHDTVMNHWCSFNEGVMSTNRVTALML